eukprot:11171737-Lingulodinium_polyedra.AAC.1
MACRRWTNNPKRDALPAPSSSSSSWSYRRRPRRCPRKSQRPVVGWARNLTGEVLPPRLVLR